MYQVITRTLIEDSHQVLTSHLAESNVLSLEAAIDPLEVYTRDITWVQASDVLIAEVSVPSHGVGYEIGYALGLGKPVLALYQEGRRVSKMISGNPDPSLFVLPYESVENAVVLVRSFLSKQLIRELRH